MRDVPLYNIDSRRITEGEFEISVQEETRARETTPHMHDHFMIVLLCEGHATHSLDFVEYEVVAPALVFIGTGQVHNQLRSRSAKSYIISFTSEFILSSSPDFLAHLFSTPRVNLSSQEFDKLLPFAELLYDEYNSNPGESRVLSNLLLAFLEKM